MVATLNVCKKTSPMNMNIIKLRKKREMVTVPIAMTLTGLGLLIYIDVHVLNHPVSRPTSFGDWANLLFINIFPAMFVMALMFLTLPDFLTTYTEEGIKRPSLRKPKFMRWSEVTSVEDRYTFWKARQLILKSFEEEIAIAPQIFVTEDEIVDELRKRIPENLWIKTRP